MCLKMDNSLMIAQPAVMPPVLQNSQAIMRSQSGKALPTQQMVIVMARVIPKEILMQVGMLINWTLTNRQRLLPCDPVVVC